MPSPVPAKHKFVEIGFHVPTPEPVVNAQGKSLEVREHPMNPRHEHMRRHLPDYPRPVLAVGNIGVTQISVSPDFTAGTGTFGAQKSEASLGCNRE